MRKVILVLCLLSLAASWFFWPAHNPAGRTAKAAAPRATAVAAAGVAALSAPLHVSTLNLTNPLAFRLTNTTQSLGQLTTKPHAILLENALIDTDARLALNIPAHLKAGAKPGAYIVQARGLVNAPFRALLTAAGAQMVSYIPNNAYLVKATANEAGLLAASPLVQAVLPYEPYYKLQPSLLGLAVAQKPLPPGTQLTLGLFSAGAADTEAQIEKMGGAILARDRSPFGAVVRVQPPTDWIALGQLPGVQIIEPARERKPANDLSRVTVGVATDTLTTTNYLGLTGVNVTVAVVDSGVDATHPDFTTGGNPTTPGNPPVRVLGLAANDLLDTTGHGTHVAGIIAGNGSKSFTVGSGARGSVTNADFRGKAPLATLFSMRRGAYSESVLQETAALTNALISNNSWNNGAAGYDLAAASYDAATRDAVPELTGSQPVLFVFSAGNSGGGDDATGVGGNADSVESPGTAKNVITVGALEQLRNITNIVTVVVDGVTNQTQPWKDMTSTSYLVPGYSSRGNVGIGTEGTYGRFKPDVVAPGTFVVSTRSSLWDTNAFLNPTNYDSVTYDLQTVGAGSLNASYSLYVPPNALGVIIQVLPNAQSATPFPANIPVYVALNGAPDTNNFDILTTVDGVSIPPDNGGAISGLQAILDNTIYFGVGNNGTTTLNYNLRVTVLTTNVQGDYYQQLLGLDDKLGPYYCYEGMENLENIAGGTSMAAADASGVLALMADYFINTRHQTPSPALLKAMLINGARPTGTYDFQVQNNLNYEGWGLINLPNSIPASLTNSAPGGKAIFFLDQSPTNALATGDAVTYNLAVSSVAASLPLRVTLAWTDPPGNPAAAIKLVNNLDLVVTNLDDPANPLVFYGNDIGANHIYNTPTDTNLPPNLDEINNIENVFLPPNVGTNFSITVFGRAVNVNAVTAQTNDVTGNFAPNIVQDFALVISSGDSANTNGFTLTSSLATIQPTSDQRITIVTNAGTPLIHQHVGASSPLLGTAQEALGNNTGWGPNGVVTLGMTNQWHFYVVTNNGAAADFTNALFVTFLPPTLSVPREGVLNPLGADNATRPEADIDLYVTTDSSLTNLNPAAIANCLAGSVSSGVSLGRGGSEIVYLTHSTPGEVYYVGVKSEDQMAAEYDFYVDFSNVGLPPPTNGPMPVVFMSGPIPDGDAVHPGYTNFLGICLGTSKVNRLIVTNVLFQQNVGDLVIALDHSAGGGNKQAVLLNHDSPNAPGTYTQIYDDSAQGGVAGSQPSDGPGSLNNFRTFSENGVWLLHAADNAPAFIGSLAGTMFIQPHRVLKNGETIVVTVPAHGWYFDYVDVGAGYTNLTIAATNHPPTAVPLPLQLYEKFGNDPTLTDYDQESDLIHCISGNYPTGTLPGTDISVGPPLNMGRYFYGLYNPDATDSTNVWLSYTLGYDSGANNNFDYASGLSTPLLDDAVSTSTITVPNTVTQLISSVSVGLVVNSPRISDLTFTLVSPTGQRVLLMENRGGTDTNGAGMMFVYTNILNTTASGHAAPNTNYLGVSILGETVPITYDFYHVVDEMTVYGGSDPTTFYTNSPYFIYDTGFTNNGPAGGPYTPTSINVSVPPGYTNITIIMNQFGNPYAINGDDWTYTAGAPMTNYEYLEFTDDTNLANLPIKFAPTPFSFDEVSSNYTLCDFELATNGNYFAPANIYDAFGGWNLPTNLVTVSTVFNITNDQYVQVTNVVTLVSNEVSVVTDPSDSIGDNVGTNLLALANGTITRDIATVPGRIYNVTFWYRGPGIASWWRGEGDATDSSDPEKNANNGTLVGRFNFPAGEVGQAFGFQDAGEQFEFAGTNTYVQIPQNPSLDVGKGGGFTVEGWINPTNVAHPQPLVEWLAHVPTNTAVTNIVILAGPYLDRATEHYYYLLGATNWTTSELWATELGGHLVTLDTANEQSWVFDNFADYGDVNRNLWLGLTNKADATFVWSSGLTNIAYTNWMSGQPDNTSGTRHYTFMRGETNLPASLWMLADNNGFVQGSAATNIVYGVVEVNQIQTNGVQFWVSVTNSMPGGTNQLVSTNGCLYANLIDTSNVWHEVYSAPGLIQSNVFQHVALTFDTNSGLAMLYLNGTNVATTNLFMPGGVFAPFVPKTDGDVLLGRDMTLCTNNYFGGEMDEMSIYKRALSGAEIAAIYRLSATATNGLTGKFDPSVTPEPGLAEAEVVFGTTSNLIFGVNNQWEQNSYTFTATSNTMPLRITGVEPGILLDNFAVSEAPLTNLYYLPEQSLNDALTGTQANGDWQLQVWDNRVGAYVTNFSSLVNWQLNFILVSNAQISATLMPQTPTASTVGPGQTVYYQVNVPAWAKLATNILVSSDVAVDLLFNPTNLPTGSNPGDQTLLTASTGGVGLPVLAVNSPLPFTAANQAGTTYYLGVRNSGIHAASVVLEVDYDITALTNGIPYSGTLAASDALRYFSFNVTSNAYEATFQLLKMSSNADLVIRKGVPLPTLTNTDYGSFNATNADENIYVLTNSFPVPLTAGTWYLGVIKRDSGAVNYTVLAKELDTPTPTIIDLTNVVPFTFTAGPGAALTNFFRFHVTNAVSGLRFELYDLSGNGDLTLQTNALPLSPPFYQSSQNPGRSAEMIWVYTNAALTNLIADWYLGVPNHEITNISYTIVASIDTNGYFPAFPGAEGSGGGAVGAGHAGVIGSVYHVFNLNDSGYGSLRDAVSANNRTVIFDVSGTIYLQSRLVITNSYLTLAGQTAPGDGITVAGWETSVTNAHDVIIRYLRFRPGDTNGFDALRFITASNLIADHVSATWAPRQVVSALDSTNLTVQWSVIAEQLYDTSASDLFDGTQLRLGHGSLSFHHNLYADNNAGSPHLADNVSLDFVNNVIYNWGTNSGFSSVDPTNNPNGATNQLNYTCNYLIAGPHSFQPWIAFHSGSTNTWMFQTNNLIDTNYDGVLNGGYTQWEMFTNRITNQITQLTVPLPLVRVGTDEAFKAYERVLAFAGNALMARDAADTNIVNGVRTQTGTIISSQTQVGGWPALASTAPPLDSDQDGIPDYWEITFGQDPTNASDFLPSTHSPGYSDLEEYLNWLAGPHAVTTNNGPVAVDLYKLSGNTGHLAFFVTNAVNGTVYLTNVLGSVTNTGPLSNSIAIFTPTNASPYASFDYYITNTDTMAYFGPVTVSVVVSSVPVTTGTIITLTNLVPYTNLTVTTGLDYYRYDVSTNCYGVKYEILNPSGDVNLYARYGLPLPMLGTPSDTSTNGGTTNELILVLTNTAPVSFTNGWWYLAVSNASGAPVSYTILVTELVGPIFVGTPADTNLNELTLLTVTNNATPPNPADALNYSVFLTVNTNAMNLLGWTNSFANTTNTAPAIDTNGVITWIPSEAQGPGVYTITTIATDTNAPPTSATNSFTVTVNEVNTPPYWPTNTPSQTNYTIPGLTTLVVSNTALDADLPTNPLTYQLIITNSPAITNAVIDTNGIITWTPTLAQTPGVYTFETIVTDTNAYALTNQVLSATNYFTITVTPVSLPFAYTEPAQSANGQSAQLDGMVTPNGLPTTAWFQWGTSTNYGLVTPASVVGSNFNFNVIYTASTVTGLTVNLPYHYRLVASNAVGVTFGFDRIFDQGNVVAWGADFLGQTVPIPTGLTNLVTAIGAGYDFSIALNNNGTVVAWGDDIFGQTNVPAGLTNAVSVSGGYKDGLALRRDRSVIVWGSNQFHQTNVPATLTNAVLAVSGDWHCLALRDDGTVVPWGNNLAGQTNLPAGLSNIVSIASGGYHSLALKNDGTLVAWGDNSYGQTNVPAGLSNVVAVAGGESHSVALKNDGTIIAWGDNSLGQTNTQTGSNFIAIACGGFHSLALRNDGTVTQWGDSSAGQNPVFATTNLSNTFAIAGSGGGGFHSLALTSLFGLNQTNNAPFWTNSPTVTIFLLTNQPANVLFTNAASDTNVPAQILSYKLLNRPSWASIGQYTGVITFSNVEPQGLGTNLLTVVVTDNGYPVLSATNTVTVVVYEINTPPFWPANVPSQTNYVINAANLLTVTDTASDADLPTNVLTYSVSVSGGVTNAFVNPTNGIFTWTPAPEQASINPYTVTVTVMDTNVWALTSQTLSATNTFTVTVLPPLTLTNGAAQTNVLVGNSVNYYLVKVPTNADFATNTLLFAAPAGVNVWLTTNASPSVGATNDSLLITNSTGNSAVIGTANVPLQFPNSLYWLGVQNTNSFAVTNALEVNFHLILSATNLVNISSIVQTNILGTNGYLLTWFAPSNDLFQVQWTPSLAPVNWTPFTNPPSISFNPTIVPVNPTNAQFNFFDDASQTGGSFGTNRFYRLLLLTNAPNTAPVFGSQPTNYFVTPTATLTVTNSATDSDSPPQTLTYALVSPPLGVTINATNGVITWITSLVNAGTTNPITTIVTDSGIPPLSATNRINVFVNPLPVLGSVVLGTNGMTLQWSGWTNEQFQVQWTTNLAPPNWTAILGNITSTNGQFTFLDTNTPFLTKFYQLILLP